MPEQTDVSPDLEIYNHNNTNRDESVSDSFHVHIRAVLYKINFAMVPHSFEQVETGTLRPNLIRNLNYFRPSYAESILFYNEYVNEKNMVLTVEKILSTVDTPSTQEEACKARLAHRFRAAMRREAEDLFRQT